MTGVCITGFWTTDVDIVTARDDTLVQPWTEFQIDNHECSSLPAALFSQNAATIPRSPTLASFNVQRHYFHQSTFVNITHTLLDVKAVDIRGKVDDLIVLLFSDIPHAWRDSSSTGTSLTGSHMHS